jgi:uncharacterized protein (DUF302 family)
MTADPPARRSGGTAADAGVITKTSPGPVADTVTRLTDALASHGLKVFAVIDQQAEARAVGLDLRETTLVIFGNPAAGSRAMDAAPLVALDLPLKVLVWADAEGETRISYTDPSVSGVAIGRWDRIPMGVYTQAAGPTLCGGRKNEVCDGAPRGRDRGPEEAPAPGGGPDRRN